MNTRSIITKTLGAAVLSAALVGIAPGVADARPATDSLKSNCQWQGGKFQVYYGSGGVFFGSMCTVGNIRYSYDKYDSMHIEEHRQQGRWVEVWNRGF